MSIELSRIILKFFFNRGSLCVRVRSHLYIYVRRLCSRVHKVFIDDERLKHRYKLDYKLSVQVFKDYLFISFTLGLVQYGGMCRYLYKVGAGVRTRTNALYFVQVTQVIYQVCYLYEVC